MSFAGLLLLIFALESIENYYLKMRLFNPKIFLLYWREGNNCKGIEIIGVRFLKRFFLFFLKTSWVSVVFINGDSPSLFSMVFFSDVQSKLLARALDILAMRSFVFSLLIQAISQFLLSKKDTWYQWNLIEILANFD